MLVTITTLSLCQVHIGELSNPEPVQLMLVLKLVPEGSVILIFVPAGSVFVFLKSIL